MFEITREYLTSLVGKNIKFNEKIVNWDSYAEPNMNGIITKFLFDERNDPVHKVWVDFSPFEEENHKLQNANYYDKNGNATLTAVEAGYYTSVEDFYIDPQINELPFEVIENNNEKLYSLRDFPDRADFANAENYADAVDQWYKQITA